MMIRMIKKFLLTMVLLVSFGCSKQLPSKPKILVTIPPYATLVQMIADDHVDVEIFVLPGSNPHTFEPSPEQIKKFVQAKIWFRIGDPIETKMVVFLKERNVEVIDLSQGYTLLSGQGHTHADGSLHEEKDLHLWLDPTLVTSQVKEITRALSQQFPEMAATFEEKSRTLEQQLFNIDQEIMTKLLPFRGEYLLTSHPAFGYYCHRYQLHQLSVEVEGKDPLPQDIAHLMRDLKDHPVPVLFVEPQYNQKGARMLAQKLEIPIEEVNPYDEDYFGMLTHLTDAVVKYYGHPSS